MASAPVVLPKNSMEICINIFIDIFQMNGFFNMFLCQFLIIAL